jgi:hypothetical protein
MDMHGDFSRDSFDARNHFTRVLMQQGRVLLDADWNEQTSILLQYLRALAADLIGPHGGPGGGFEIRCRNAEDHLCDFTIGWGHYYVDGILVENAPPVRYASTDGMPPLGYHQQPGYPLASGESLRDETDYLVYLDVWERHLTYLQEEQIRDVALGGPDTTTRTQVVWQVKVADEREVRDAEASCEGRLRALVGEPPRWLRARTVAARPSDDPDAIQTEAGYRGAGNQLYLVEIHDPAAHGQPGTGATFKWSRDNGSIVFRIGGMAGSVVTLDTPGPDEQRTLEENDRVEVIDDYNELRGEPGVLARVDTVDRITLEVTLALDKGAVLPPYHRERHPLLRRWDQGSSAIPLRPGSWMEVEHGIEVWFEPGGGYRVGDYWMIPARTATGDILWPRETNADATAGPAAMPPNGIGHHYAPLARIRFKNGEAARCDDCRRVVAPLLDAQAAAPAVTRAARRPSSRR